MNLGELISELINMELHFGAGVPVQMLVDNASSDIQSVVHEVDKEGKTFIKLDDYRSKHES